MKKKTPSHGPDSNERIAQLVRIVRQAEEELQALAGGQLDAVVGDGDAPYLPRDAQARLRASEAAQRALAETQVGILNALPAHIALLDSHGVIVVVNEAWRRFASANVLQSTDFFVGQNYLGVCESAYGECADEAQAVASGIRKVLGGELTVFAIEYPCHSPTEQRWFRLMVTPVSDAPVTGAVVMHINVTERRLAEEVLRQKEQEQRRLAEALTIETRRLHQSQAAANVGSWEWDLATLEVNWTDETFRIFETGPDQFTPTRENVRARVHPEDRQRVDGALTNALDRPGPFVIEHRLLFPDGRIKHIELRGQVSTDATGSPVRAVGTCQDITRRKQADEVVRMRARQQETIARIGLEATRTTTLEGIFEFATHAIADALGVELCKVLQLAPDGSHLRLVSGVGWQAGLVGVGTVGVDRESQAGFTLTSDGPVYVNDFATETRFAAPPLLRQHGVVSGLSVTIMLRDQPWGVLGAHCRVARSFTDSDADFMQAVVTLLAVAIERLAVERTLTESEARMRDAQRIAHLGDWQLDIAKNELSWSAEVFRIFGIEPSAFAATYENFFGFVHPDDRDAQQAAQQAALSGRGRLDIEHRIIRPDGSTRHVRERGELIHDESGRPVALSGTVLDITDLRAAQGQAERMNTLLTEAERIANMGSWEMDLTSGSLIWSEETCRLFGIPQEEFAGTVETFTGSILAEDRAVVGAIHAAVTPGAPLLEAEYRIRRPDGEVRWMFERGRVTFDAAGQAVRRLGVVMDVTERKRAEANLRESEQLLRIAGRVARMGAWSVNFPEVRITWSDEVCAIHDMPAGTVPALDQALAFYAPNSRPVIESAFSRCASDGTPFDVEIELLSAKGQHKWVRSIGQAERDQTGAIRRVHGAFQDISQQKQAEATLRVSEERFRLLSKATNDAIWDWNFITNELWWNEGYEHLFGYARADVDPTIKSWMDHIHPDDLARVTDDIRRVIDHGSEAWSDEYRFRCKDGRYAHVLDRGHVIRDAAGTAVRMIGGMTDLTQQKEHEIALFQSNRALELLSRCNEALIRSEKESDLLAAICQIAVDIGGFRLAWVGYALEDADKSIVGQSHAGIDEGYLSSLRITWAEHDPFADSPAGKVIRHGEPVVIPDLETDESYRPWLEAARARGFKGVIALPLTDQTRTFGVLVMYLPEARPPLPDEMRLLQELADNMAFGIVNLRALVERQRMHTAVARVAASVSAAASADFFEQLTRNMVAALGADAGFVAEVLPGEPATSRAIAVVVDGQVTANFDYVLEGTPCENFFTSDTCVIHEQVARQFPLSPTLAALGAEGFVGRRLDNASGAFIGQMVVIFRKPLKDADFVVSALHIFSARAAAEMERQETDTRLREQAALLDKARDAILVRDLAHRITYWNSSAERLYGWTTQEALGRSVKELLYFTLGMFDQAMETLIARGEWTGELKHRRKDGRIVDIEGRWTLLRDAAGQPKAVLCINTDITERRQHERLAQRSQRLESIGTLAGGIAHDLNNALAPIMLSGELLRMEYPGESHLLDTIQACAQRGADMVRQLLTFARGAEGERASLQPGRVLTELENLMKGSFPKNIRLVVTCDPTLPTVRGNATQLHQVLLNLCVNARDAMPDGGTLTVEAKRVVMDPVYASAIPDARPGTYVALSVRDTGTGIAPDVLDRIFDPFFTTKGPDKGTGLGLSTVMGLVNGHGGFLHVYSQPGQGSVFTSYLPAGGAGSDTQLATVPEEEFRGQGETILLVDDEAAVRDIARAVLRRLNFNPLTAIDGADGLAKAAQHRTEIQAIITDLHMPHMDGLEFVRTLRRMLPHIPVLVASGRNEDHMDAEFKTLGVRARIDKPFTQGQLAEALQRLLQPR